MAQVKAYLEITRKIDEKKRTSARLSKLSRAIPKNHPRVYDRSIS